MQPGTPRPLPAVTPERDGREGGREGAMERVQSSDGSEEMA